MKITIQSINGLLAFLGFGILFFSLMPYLSSYMAGQFKWDPSKDRMRVFFHLLFFLLICLLTNELLAIYPVSSRSFGVSEIGLTGLNLMLVAVSFIFLLKGRYFWTSSVGNINLTKTDDYESNTDRKLREIFRGNSFNELIDGLRELKVINVKNEWVGGPLKRTRDVSLLMAILIDAELLNYSSKKEIWQLAKDSFSVDFDYAEMTKLIKDIELDEIAEKDLNSYRTLDFVKHIRC
ncbi:hypothetical protein [Zobellia russellii]|uniref:hypothetical protein n=1 Tax=Zobellia russellii TaxID=248907 RepID=UPI001BFF2FBC|nr:hypothetical protein [Zobellia russellii]MBT9187770.1 hypothetical protein [Zobellia russellii]